MLWNTHSLYEAAKLTWYYLEYLNIGQFLSVGNIKNGDIDQYVKHEIKFQIRTAKIDWLNREYDEIARLQLLHNDFNLHKKT